MAWEPGYAFWGSGPGWDHLHFVVSPAAANGDVVVANLTTRRQHSDTTCVVHPGDHPSVAQPSVVSYFHSRVVSRDHLANLLAQGTLQPRPPLSLQLLERVVRGFEDSEDVPESVRVEMELHGLIGPGAGQA